jgi:hypothetical protein
LPFAVTAKAVDVPVTVQPFEDVRATLYVLDEYTPLKLDDDEQLHKRAEATPVAELR